MNTPSYPIISSIVKHRVRNTGNPEIVRVMTSLGDEYYLPSPQNPPQYSDDDDEYDIVNNREWDQAENCNQNNDVQWIEFNFQDLFVEITDYYLRCDFPISEDENVISNICLLGSNDHQIWDVLDEFEYNVQNLTVYRTLDGPHDSYSYIRLCCQRLENTNDKILDNFVTSIFDFDFHGHLF